MTQNIENPDRLLKWGLGGAVFAALCCFTPLLVVVVAGVGLSALTGWLDYALFPLLFFCLAVVAQALWLRAGRVDPHHLDRVPFRAAHYGRCFCRRRDLRLFPYQN